MGRRPRQIRGMFVHPKQVDEVVKRFPEVTRARLVVSGEMANDVMTLMETGASADGLAARIGETIVMSPNCAGWWNWCSPEAYPMMAKVIEDARSYK